MRDTPRMDIFAACCVPAFVKSLKEVFFLFGRKAKLPDKKDVYNCFLKTCQILCQHEWVGPWSLVSANCRKTHTDTHWTTWQQSGNKPICAFCLKDVCVYIYIYIYMSHISYIYIYLFTQTQSYIIYIYVCVVPKIFGHDLRFHFAPILFRVLRTVVSCFPCFVLSKKYWADAATDLRILH